MKRPAIVCLYWDRHLTALIHFLATHPCVVLVPSSYTVTLQLKELIAEVGGEVVVLDSFLDQPLLDSVRERSAQLHDELPPLFAGADWQAFAHDHTLDPDAFAALVGHELPSRLEEEMAMVAALDRAATQYRIELVAMSVDYTRLPRTLVTWARAHGIPSLHVAHGLPLATPYTVHAQLNADLYAVYGKRAVEAGIDAGMPGERLRATGNPGWDDYAQVTTRRPEKLPEVLRVLREKYPLATRPTVVFATTWKAGLSALEEASGFDDGLRAFLCAVRDLRALGKDWNFVIKDRDDGTGQQRALVAQAALAAGVDEGDYLYACDDAQPWVLCADALVAIDSNMLVEAMHVGLPAINLLNEQGLLMGPSFAADAGILEITGDVLADTLVRAVEDVAFRAELAATMQLRLPDYNLGADGRAAQRVAAVMSEAIAAVPATAAGESPEEDPAKHYVWHSLGGSAGAREAGEVYMDVPRQEVVGLFSHPPRRVLEIGCATGATAKHLKSIYPQAWIAGIELSEAAAATARGRMDLVINAKFEDADLEAHGIVAGSIDAVIVADVLEHIYDPWGVLVRLKPYLTADAEVIASIPNARNLWLLNELANGRFPYAPVGLLDITHIRFFTRAEIVKLFSETGYAIDAWLRTPDPRLLGFQWQPGVHVVETEKLALKDVSLEEFEDLKTLQFVVRARPGGRLVLADSATASSRSGGPGGPLRVAVYSLDHPLSACAQIRFLRPFKALAGQCELLWAVREEDGCAVWDEAAIARADVVVISRLFPSVNSQTLIEVAFASGKPVIYETDDLLTGLPADNPHAREYAAHAAYIESVCQRAHAVVVSTPGLAAAIKVLNPRQHILPNLIDFTIFQRMPPDKGRQINIGVIGTSARGSDFALIDAALRKLCAEYGKRLRIKFVGALPEGWQGHGNAEFIPFTPDYGGYAARLKGLDLDIGLAPLAEHGFNASKSAIKWLEFSALGMAGVFSNVPAYAGVVEQGVTGLLVSNRSEKWVNAIKLLIDYPEKRLEIAMSAQLKVLQEHSLQRQGARVMDLYRSLAGEAGGAPAEAVESAPAPVADNLYQLWQLGHAYQPRDMRWMAERMAAWQRPARVHLGVICPVGAEGLLAANLTSLGQQFHKDWRLSVVAECAAPGELAQLPQVHWQRLAGVEPIAALNALLMAAEADWVGMIEAGDRLAAHALFAIVDALQRHPDWHLLYSDEDRLGEDGVRHTPFFKSDFDPDMLRAAPFCLGGVMLMARALFTDLAGFDVAAEGVETWDLALRASERLAADQIGHIADVLYHRYQAGGHNRRDGEATLAAARDVLGRHLARLGWPGEVRDGLLPGTFHIRYALQGTPLVSIIIPAHDQAESLKGCLTSLIERTGYSHCEILVVDNGSDDPETLAYLQSLRDLGSDSLRVLELPGAHSDSAMNNLAVRAARGEFLLLLGHDTQVLHGDWLEEMLGYAQRADVGVVGARLRHPDGCPQRAGVILGLGDMASDQTAPGASADQPGYFGRLQLPQSCSALAAGCLLTRKSLYEALGGLDEGQFSAHFNDVDYCLKLRERGLKVVWTPHATLHHAQAVHPAGGEVAGEKRASPEVEAITAKWPSWFANDPAYNRNLSLILPFQTEPTPALSWDPEWRPRPRILSMHADVMGCGEYRIIAPMRALNHAGKVMGWDAAGYFHVREYARMAPDSIVFQRQVQPGQIEYIERISRRYPGVFRVFEIDDLITNIPIMSSQKSLFVEQKDINKRFRKAVGLCQRFVVSTEYLAETYKGYCDEVVAVPNYLERARWDGLTPKRRGGAKARVGWAGSATHAGDLRLIIDVVQATADEVDWVFFGMCPDAIRPLVREYHESVRLDDYAAKLATLDLDLAIAPLEDVAFNHGKSHLRLLEYGVLGYPVICTDITPYRGGYPVTRVPNKFKPWVEAIRSHVADRDELARRGDALRAHVQTQWMLEDHLDVWLKAWLPS